MMMQKKKNYPFHEKKEKPIQAIVMMRTRKIITLNRRSRAKGSSTINFNQAETRRKWALLNLQPPLTHLIF